MSEPGTGEGAPNIEKWDNILYASPIENFMIGSTFPGMTSESFIASLENGQEPARNPLLPQSIVDDPQFKGKLDAIRERKGLLVEGDMIPLFGNSGMDLTLDPENPGFRISIKLGSSGQDEWLVDFTQDGQSANNSPLISKVQVEGPLQRVLEFNPRLEGGMMLKYNPDKIKPLPGEGVKNS